MKLLYRTGKKPAKRDARNFLLSRLLAAKPVKPPAEYNVDIATPGVKNRMLVNDVLGDCVEAASVNFILRAELRETKKLVKITDAEIRRQYFRETGGVDSGLVVLDHLNLWRRSGLLFDKRYFIEGFAEIKPLEHTLVMRTVATDVGAICGVSLPSDAMDDFVAGKPWTSTKHAPDPLEGHCVWIVGYTKLGPVFLTWARPQQATWPWWDRYCDECYATIDAVDKAKRLVDPVKFHEHLKAA